VLPRTTSANNQAFAEGVNNRGDVFGWYNDLSHNHGFLYNGHVYVALNDPLATTNTFAQSILLANRPQRRMGFQRGQ
jgi:hypothetical protein